MTGGRRPAGSRRDVLPAPERSVLEKLPVHVVAADYPETVEPLRSWGIELPIAGDRPLDEAVGAAGIEELHVRLEWRGRGARTPSKSPPE